MTERKKLIRNESEAIECLKSNTPLGGYSMLQESVAMAVQALEKQISKKPTYEGDGYADGHLVYDTWICPRCEKRYEVDYDNYDYCPNCGQKLDWEDDDE